MGLEDLASIEQAAALEAQADEQADRLKPDYEPMTCTLTSGQKVIFDVPNTDK